MRLCQIFVHFVTPNCMKPKIKRRTGIREGYRLVRIDHRTLIEVAPDKTDEEAIVQFLEKLAYSKAGTTGRVKMRNIFIPKAK